MSESPSKGDTPAAKAVFTDREESVLKVAWFCLKSGAPEIDIKKLTKAGGFNTEKTASNTWGVIKKKLAAMAPVEDGNTAEGTNGDASTATTPKKRTKKEFDDNDAPSTAKKSRKTPTKKAKAVEEEDADQNEEHENHA